MFWYLLIWRPSKIWSLFCLFDFCCSGSIFWWTCPYFFHAVDLSVLLLVPFGSELWLKKQTQKCIDLLVSSNLFSIWLHDCYFGKMFLKFFAEGHGWQRKFNSVYLRCIAFSPFLFLFNFSLVWRWYQKLISWSKKCGNLFFFFNFYLLDYVQF